MPSNSSCVPKALNALIRKEIQGDTERHGDAGAIAHREACGGPGAEAAGASCVPSEPITVILSKKGWVRAAKGHDIDPTELAFRSGDEFRAAACGHSQQPAVFLDSTGRCCPCRPMCCPRPAVSASPLPAG